MHPKLARQLRDFLGDPSVTDPKLQALLAAISASYQADEDDRALLERNVEQASTELSDRNAQLQRELESIKRLEFELLQAEKLRAMGQLASGIAHEINTPIQFVGDSVHFVKSAFADLGRLAASGRELASSVETGLNVHEAAAALRAVEAEIDLEYLLAELPRAFEQTDEGIRRVAQIVRAMKDFGRVDRGETVLTDLNRCLDSTVTVAHNEIKYVADLQVATQELPEIRCHAGEISQVFLNLLVNAAHAVAARFEGTGERGLVRISSERQEREVVVTISDNGAGISEEHRARIFEPFFTTKPLGKGTGQGLSIARAIVEKHGGSLSFESTPGQGTSFHVRLPLEGRPTAIPAGGGGAAS